MNETSSLLIMIVLLSPTVSGLGVAVHPITSTDNANEPLQTCESVVDPTSSSRYELPLENGVAQPNLWGLGSASGSVEQCYGANGLQTSVRLSAIKSTVTEPLGYPEVIYGDNLEDQPVPSGGTSQLGFPLQLSSFDTLNLWATAKYSISTPTPASMPYRLFYDLWLERNPASGKPPSSADFEIGVSFAYTPLSPLEIPIPISTLSNEPIIINGQTETSKWSLYKALSSGTSAPFYQFFLVSPTQQPSATISIRLQDFIDYFGDYLSSPENYLTNLLGPHSLSGYRLMGIELGTEFAGGIWELTEPSNVQLNWDWCLSSYSFSTTSPAINLITSQAQNAQTTTRVCYSLEILAERSVYAVNADSRRIVQCSPS